MSDRIHSNRHMSLKNKWNTEAACLSCCKHTCISLTFVGVMCNMRCESIISPKIDVSHIHCQQNRITNKYDLNVPHQTEQSGDIKALTVPAPSRASFGCLSYGSWYSDLDSQSPPWKVNWSDQKHAIYKQGSSSILHWESQLCRWCVVVVVHLWTSTS